MNLPRLLTPDEVAEYLSCSVSSLDRWRAEGTGPNFVKVGGGSIRYPETEVAKYISEQLVLPSAAQKMQDAIRTSSKEVAQAHRERVKAMQDLDRQTTDPADPYAVTVSGVGETPGIERHVFQDGKWVKNGILSQPAPAEPAPPHILQGR